MAVDLTPTSSIAAAARKGLRLHEDGKSGDGLVAATVRDARRMAAREPLSEAKVRRMPGWFARHETDKTPGWDEPGNETPGYVAWLLWGGDTARRWAERKVKEMDNDQQDRSVRAVLPDGTVVPDNDDMDDVTPEPLAATLATLLADSVTMYLHAHGAHWVVKGGAYGTFAQWHSLFADIYTDVHDSLDPLAENIQKLGYDAPFRMTDLIGRREIEDEDVQSDDPTALALMLLQDNVELLECLNKAFAAATLENQQGIANFLADRIDMHQKWAWQLKSSLGVQDSATPPMDEDAGDDDDAPVAAGSTERSFSPVKVAYRESGAGANYRVLQGYAAVFNKPSDDLGGFREVIAPGAFRNALMRLDERPAKLLYDHDTAAVLASTANGTLELREDDIGLRVWARVDMDDPDVQRVAAKLRSGIVDQMSFGFTVADDEWDYTGGMPMRTVREIGTVFEASLVAFPAYNDTKVAMLERARHAGRLPDGGASHVAPVSAGGESHTDGVDPAIRAAYWRARLNLSKQKVG